MRRDRGQWVAEIQGRSAGTEARVSEIERSRERERGGLVTAAERRGEMISGKRGATEKGVGAP